MFTEEQRSWQLPGDLIWVCLFLICFSLVSCSATRTTAADRVREAGVLWMLSRHEPSGSSPLLRPPEGQAS